MMTIRRVACVLFASCAAVSAAQAQSISASLEVTGLRVSLVDLKTGDKVTPSITFTSPGGRIDTGATIWQAGDVLASDGDFANLTEPQPSGGIKALLGSGSSTSSIDGGNLLASGSASTTGFTLFSKVIAGPNAAQHDTGVAYSDITPFDWFGRNDFLVSANTELRIEGDYKITVSRQDTQPSAVSLEADAFLGLFASIGAEAMPDVMVEWGDFASTSRMSPQQEDLVVSDSFSFRIANTSATSQEGRINFTSQAQALYRGLNPIAPIPEPSTFALGLLGLLGLGFAASRRRLP